MTKAGNILEKYLGKSNLVFIVIVDIILLIFYYSEVYGNIQYNAYFVILMGIVNVCMMITCLGERLKCRLEKIYSVILIILASCYLIIFMPSSINDELYHMTMAYHYSNVIMGVADNDVPRGNGGIGATYVRKCDREFLLNELCYWGVGEQLAYRPNTNNYQEMYNAIFETVSEDDKELVANDISGYSTGTNMIEYIPSVIAITFARLLGMNSFFLFYFAKIFQMIAYCILCIWAIHKIPKFKLTLALITLLPITLQEATGISYDGLTMGLAFALFADLLCIIHSAEIKNKELIECIALTALLMFCKNATYFLIPLIAFFELFRNKMDKKKCISFATVYSLIIVGLLFVQFANISSANGVQNGEKYSYSYVLHYPFEFFQMFARTISENASYYIESMAGRVMGWNQIVVPTIVVWAFVFSLIYSTGFYKTTEPLVRKEVKAVCLVVVILEVGLIFAALLGDTTWQSKYIEGVQGRYLLPILPVFLIIFARENNDLNEKYRILKTFIVIHLFEMFYMMKLFLGR